MFGGEGHRASLSGLSALSVNLAGGCWLLTGSTPSHRYLFKRQSDTDPTAAEVRAEPG